MQTPFNADGPVNYGRWAALIDQYLETGMHGLVLGSGTGQHACLTEAECNRLFELGIKRINARPKVTAQASALNLDEVVRRSKAAQDLADARRILPHFFDGSKNEDGIRRFYETINSAVSRDIIGYNITAAAWAELTPALYTRPNQLENFKYIKGSSGDLCKLQALLACGGQILNGAEPTAPFSFMLVHAGHGRNDLGCANIFSREAAQLFERISADQHAEGQKPRQRLFPIVNYCWQNDYIPAVKAAGRQMGFDGGTVRAPICEVGPEEKVRVAAALAPLRAA